MIAAALNPWIPDRRVDNLAALGKLGEELGELASAVGRCIMQGIDEAEPVTGKVNRVWLEDEIADVLAAIGVVTQHFDLDRERMAARVSTKDAHLKNWHRLMLDEVMRREGERAHG